MTIEKDRDTGNLVAHCENCSEIYESDGNDFHAIVEEIKQAGWKIEKVGSDWQHFCPSCVEDAQAQI